MIDYTKKGYKIAAIALIFAIIGWVLPAQEFTPTSYINASHIYSTGLTNTSGDNISSISEFDNITWKGEEQNGLPWVIDIVFENVSHFDNTESMLRYFSASGTPSTHQVEFEIFCILENSFTNLHTFTNQNDFNYFPKKFPDSHHFIFPNGTVILRLNHTANGNVNHRIWIDSMRLVIQPQYEQVNASINNYYNTTDDDSAYVLKSGSTWTGNMIMDGTTITTNTVLDKDAYIYEDSILPTVRLRARNVSTYGYFELFPYYADILVSGRRYNFTNDSLDIGNASLINCSNCVNQTSLNGKVNTSGDTLTGKLNNTYLDIENIINITLGQLEIKSTNLTTLNTGDLVIIPDQIDIEVHNGSTNRLSLTNDTTLINIDGSDEYTFNKSSLDLKNNNITNCANCQVTGHGLARAYLNGSQLNISFSTVTKVNLNSVSYNPYNEFNVTSGNYTVPQDGYYDILASITYTDVIAPRSYVLEVRKNGTIIMFSETHSSISDFISVPSADTWYLQKNEEIGLYAIQNSGVNTVDIVGTSPGTTWMSISLKSKVPP